MNTATTLKQVVKLLLILAVVGLLAAPATIQATSNPFVYNSTNGTVLACFRNGGSYEFVANIGTIAGFEAVPAGTTINITNYTHAQIAVAFAGGFNNLNWSVVSSYLIPNNIPLVTPYTTNPVYTCWWTVPRTDSNSQTTPPARLGRTTMANIESDILSIGGGAASACTYPGQSSYQFGPWYDVEFSSDPYGNEYHPFMADPSDSTQGTFVGILTYNVENVTPASFTTPVRSDFYRMVQNTLLDPVNGTKTSPFYMGYFQLNTDGTMTFTAASAGSPPPSAGSVSSTVTNGFAPLQVVFTNTASSNGTNWIWNFGNGTIITNSSSGNVTNTYAAAGNYTVTLTVNGAGGSSSNVLANFIVTSPTPKLGSLALTGGKLVFGGTNCPAGAQYRILTATNIAQSLASWKPVWTNTFLGNGTFSYTNSATNSAVYLRLVSP